MSTASDPTTRSSPHPTRRRRISLLALAAVTPLLALLVVAPTTSSATAPSGHKVTICHRTNADTHPYVQETVDIASSGYLQAGHNGDPSGKKGHTGPVWNPTLKAQGIAWGDIIPPYVYTASSGKVFTYVGYNWTTAGRAIYDNGCVPVTSTITVTPRALAADPTCTSGPNGTLTLTPMTGVVWTIDGRAVETSVTELPLLTTPTWSWPRPPRDTTSVTASRAGRSTWSSLPPPVAAARASSR